MAITVVSTAVGASTSGLSVAVPTPANIAVGDVLVAVCVSQESTQQAFSATGWSATTAPSYGATNVAGTRIETVLTRVVADAAALAALPASATFSRGGSSNRNVATIIVLRGVDTSAPVNAVGTWVSNSTTTGVTVPALTTTRDGCLVLGLANGNASANTQMLPVSMSGFTAIGYSQSPAGTADSDISASRTLLAAFQKTQATAGSTGAPTYSQANATPGKAAFLIAFQPPAAPTFTPTPGVTWWDGSNEVPARLSYWDGTTETVAQSVELSDASYDLAALTSTAKFYVAHRGGSLSYNEMTAEAYRRSGLVMGMRALEMSVHRTSDGVFVLAHDDNLQRVTGTSISIAASTWSQLSGLAVNPPAGATSQGTQPLARLIDVLPLWIGRRVIFLEDKTYVAANRAALISYVKSLAGYSANQVVWKVAGMAGDGPALAGAQAGWKSWGYLFTGADMADASFLAKARRFDYIGVDAASNGTGFTAAEWTLAESAGVPMIAHIIATQAQLDIANAHPIVGAMLANVRELYPRG